MNAEESFLVNITHISNKTVLLSFKTTIKTLILMPFQVPFFSIFTYAHINFSICAMQINHLIWTNDKQFPP